MEVAALPRLSPRGKEVALPISASEHLLAILQRSSLAEPHPLVEEVKASVEPASAAAFTWALFEAWLASGTGSQVAQVLGRTVLLFKRRPKKPKIRFDGEVFSSEEITKPARRLSKAKISPRKR